MAQYKWIAIVIYPIVMKQKIFTQWIVVVIYPHETTHDSLQGTCRFKGLIMNLISCCHVNLESNYLMQTLALNPFFGQMPFKSDHALCCNIGFLHSWLYNYYIKKWWYRSMLSLIFFIRIGCTWCSFFVLVKSHVPCQMSTGDNDLMPKCLKWLLEL